MNIAFGLFAALAWGLSGPVGKGAAQRLGTSRALGWAMIAGFVIVLPPALITWPDETSSTTWAWLALGAVASAAGLWAMLYSYGHGALSVTAPLIATQGAITALLDVAFGASIGVAAGIAIVVATAGSILVARGSGGQADVQTSAAALLAAVGAAVFYAVGLYAAASAADEAGAFLPGLATRTVGIVIFSLPVVIAARGRFPWPDGRWAIGSGTCDIGGQLGFVGAALTGSIAVAGVLAAQGATVATLLGVILLHERLARAQVVGVGLVLVAVTVLAAAG